jgi:hypothetical protein
MCELTIDASGLARIPLHPFLIYYRTTCSDRSYTSMTLEAASLDAAISLFRTYFHPYVLDAIQPL